MVAIADTNIIKNVEVLIPPPVEPDEAPINIKKTIKMSVDGNKWLKSIVLNPAVRVVTDWKKELMIDSNIDNSFSVLFRSIKKNKTIPIVIKAKDVWMDILVPKDQSFQGIWILSRNFLGDRTSSIVAKPILPTMIVHPIITWNR